MNLSGLLLRQNEHIFYAIAHSQGEMETSPDDGKVIELCHYLQYRFK